MSLLHPTRFFAPEMRHAWRLFDEPLLRHPSHTGHRPAIEFKEKEGAFLIEAEVPGYKREDIKVEFAGDENRTLVISGVVSAGNKIEVDPSGAPATNGAPATTKLHRSPQSEVMLPDGAPHETVWISERFRGSFARSFTLPSGVDIASVKARLADGILHLTLPKLDKATPHAISVE